MERRREESPKKKAQTRQRSVVQLAGLRGRIRLAVGDETKAIVVIDDGKLALTQEPGEVRAEFRCNDGQDLDRLLRGELNPFVAALQGRFHLSGDLKFGIQVLLALRADGAEAEHRAGGEA
jgi:putative sterol carrier protein